MIARAEALTPVRVASVFAEKTEPGGSEPLADDGQPEMLDKSREVVLLDDESANSECTNYEQLRVNAGWIKLGLLCHCFSCE